MSKIEILKHQSSLKLFIAAFLAIYVFFQPLQAADNRSNAFDININVENCSGTVDMGETKNCDQAQCDGIKNCICLSRHDRVTWHLGSGEKFKLEFHGDSPLKSNCGRNFHRNQHNCVVQDAVPAGQTFDYDILVENCPEPIDPRIVIRQ